MELEQGPEVSINSVSPCVPLVLTIYRDAIYYATKYMDGGRTLREVVDAVLNGVTEKGLNLLSPMPVGDYASFRGLELAAAINRLRTLSVRKKAETV